MIVAIGDSITAGQYLAEGEMAWPRLITGYDISPAGVSNETTRQGLERFPTQVQAVAPVLDAVIIQFGTNDANRWQTDLGLPRVSLAAYRANLIEMVDRTRAFGAIPFLCTIIPTLKSMQLTKDVLHYDVTLREVADETASMLIDVRSAWSTAWLKPGPDLLMEDGVHPTAAGHRLYAKVVQEALDAWSRA